MCLAKALGSACLSWWHRMPVVIVCGGCVFVAGTADRCDQGHTAAGPSDFPNAPWHRSGHVGGGFVATMPESGGGGIGVGNAGSANDCRFSEGLMANPALVELAALATGVSLAMATGWPHVPILPFPFPRPYR